MAERDCQSRWATTQCSAGAVVLPVAHAADCNNAVQQCNTSSTLVLVLLVELGLVVEVAVYCDHWHCVPSSSALCCCCCCAALHRPTRALATRHHNDGPWHRLIFIPSTPPAKLLLGPAKYVSSRFSVRSDLVHADCKVTRRMVAARPLAPWLEIKLR